MLLGSKAMTNLDSLLKIRHYFTNKGLYSQSYGLSSSAVQMWELDHKEGWVLRNWCFYFFLIFIFTLFYFTILYWFCHTLTWIHHGCTCVPKHEPPSHLPPHNISLGHPRAPAPGILYPASDIDWRFKNTFESVLMRGMELEPIIQSEVSQKEKHQYSILTHIYGI